MGATPYVYDGLGRLVRKGELTLQYGADGQVTRAQRSGRSFQFGYGEAGQRILKKDSAGNPLVAYVGEGILTEGALVLPVRVNGLLLGVLENGTFKPQLADARGTPLTKGGALDVPTPYGVRNSSLPLASELFFVEKGYDEDLGTVRMGARDYDPYLGQFTTPDPMYLEKLGRCSESSTECNLYSYAGNDPIRFVDSAGLDKNDLPWTRAGKLAAGIAYGTVQALTPLGFAADIAGSPSNDSDFQYGKAAGNIATGTAVAVGGIIGVGGGTVVSVGSGGSLAVAGVPAAAGAVAIVEGTASVAVGVRTLLSGPQASLSFSKGPTEGGTGKFSGVSHLSRTEVTLGG